jgi:hypothetical protein
MDCQASVHGFCEGTVKPYTVLLKTRDLKYPNIPDKQVQVSMCKLHHRWLRVKGKNFNQETGQLEMYGKYEVDALDEDLFRHFQDRSSSFSDKYTLIRIEFYDRTHGDDTWFLLNGTDVELFKRNLIFEEDKPVRIMNVGLFHFDGVTVFEIEEIDEYDLEPLAESLHVFFRQIKNFDCDNQYSENSFLGYDNEMIADEVIHHFASKLDEIRFNQFELCVEFIRCELDYIVNNDISSDIDMCRLYDSFRLLTKALLEDDDEIIEEMKKEGLITSEVLWVTYVHANHDLYKSASHKTKLQHSDRLIQLFVELFLVKDLLTVAISGERERYLDSHQRSHHDILNENEYVVKKIVPLFVKPNEILNMNSPIITMRKTPLEYWHSYSNITNDIGPYNIQHSFEKNEDIRRFLEEKEHEYKSWMNWFDTTTYGAQFADLLNFNICI